MSASPEIQQGKNAPKRLNKILLMGNPNVGKSVFFTELTGIHAISSNYAGTTVNYMEGAFKVGGEEYLLIDVPGAYSLSPTSEAEAVAANFMRNGAAAVICVLDASNLERNLCLALELRRCKIPMIYALNLVDVARRGGIEINEKMLSQELGAPVVPTVAVKRQGIDELVKRLGDMLSAGGRQDDASATTGDAAENAADAHARACASCANVQCKQGDIIWSSAREITRKSSKKSAPEPTFIDKLGECMMKPFPGIPIALLAVLLLIGVVVGGGKGLRAGLLLPLVNGVIVPFFENLFTRFVPKGMFLNILVGDFGIFRISFEWIIALVLPYVFLFYVAVSFLEDSGYLPRVSVLFDNVMRKLGVQGGSLIQIITGFGCAVPAIVGTRAATTRKERIVIAAVVCFAVPCISQTGVLISLLSNYSWWMMPAMGLFAATLFIAAALISGAVVKGKVDPLIIEVPNLLMPEMKSYLRKLMIRMKHFLVEAEVPMLIAVFVAALVVETGLMEAVAVYAKPVVSLWLGLPDEAVLGLVLGIIRREMSLAPLLGLELTHLQAFVGAAVSLMYLPCLSVFGILNKEFKLKISLIICGGTVAVALLVGGVINQVGRIF